MYIKSSFKESQVVETMNMSKRLFLLLLVFALFPLIHVNAAPYTTTIPTSKKATCMNTNSQENCEKYGLCKWENGQCVDKYVAENACEDEAIKRVLKIFGYIILIAKLAIPLIIIGFGAFDLAKAVISNDEKALGKQFKQLGIRIVAGLIVFFLPSLINGILNSINNDTNNSNKMCASCILEPTSGKCD